MNNQDQPLLERAGEIYGYIESLVTHRVELLKLEIAEQVAKLLSQFLTIALLSLVAFLLILFGSLSAAVALGAWLESYPLAFLLITAFYLIIGIVLYMVRTKLITNPILKSIVKSFVE